MESSEKISIPEPIANDKVHTLDTSGTLPDPVATHGPLRNTHDVLQNRDAPGVQIKHTQLFKCAH